MADDGQPAFLPIIFRTVVACHSPPRAVRVTSFRYGLNVKHALTLK